MSKLFDNKQLLHIASEIVIIGGLSYYINNKLKIANTNMANFNSKLEELEELIKVQQKQIQDLTNNLNIIKKKILNQHPPPPQLHKNTNKVVENPPKREDNVVETKNKELENIISSITFIPMMKDNVPTSNMDIEEISDEENNLDEELKDELDELNSEENTKSDVLS
jgi:hypothetical protein